MRPQQLDAYLGGERRRFDLPLDLLPGRVSASGVVNALLHIPAGGTLSYATWPARSADPAVRAVGAAIGRNPAEHRGALPPRARQRTAPSPAMRAGLTASGPAQLEGVDPRNASIGAALASTQDSAGSGLPAH
jgi:hypothetical protein